MQNLQTLLETRQVEWKWEGRKEKNSVRYQLVITTATHESPAKLREKMQSSFREQVNLLIRIAPLPKVERLTHTDALARLMFMSDKQKVQAILDSEMNTIRAFALTTTEKERDRLTQIDNENSAVECRVTEKSALLLEEFWKSVRNNSQTTPELPQSISFVRMGRGSTKMPVLGVELGRRGRLSFLGGSFSDQGWHEYLRSIWKKEINPSPDLAASQITFSTADRKALRVPERTSDNPMLSFPNQQVTNADMALGEFLILMSEKVKGQVYAVLPPERIMTLPLPSKETIVDYLQRLEENTPGFLTQWDNKNLFVSYNDWFTEADDTLPYKYARLLAKSKEGFFGIKQFGAIIPYISEKQIQNLAKTYVSFEYASAARPLFSLLSQWAELGQSRGARLEGKIKEAVYSIQPITNNRHLKPEDADAVRFVETKGSEQGKPTLSIFVQFRDKSGKWISVWGFTQIAIKIEEEK